MNYKKYNKFYNIKNVRLSNSIDDSKRRRTFFNLNDNVGQTFSLYTMVIRNLSVIKIITNNTENNNKNDFCNGLNYLNKSLILFENRFNLIMYKKPNLSLISYKPSQEVFESSTILEQELYGPYGNMGYLHLDLAHNYLKLSPVKKHDKISELEIIELIEYTELILKQVRTIIENGYINNQDLRTYPLIKDLIPFFTNFDVYYNGIFGYQTFKWMFNLINLSLYMNIIEYEKYLINQDLNKLKIKIDEYNDLILLRKRIYQKLDPSVRKFIQKRGITIIQNLETAFDSEYVNKSLITNKTISFQMAQVIQMYLKIPLMTGYKLITINPIREETYQVKLTKAFNFKLLEEIISKHVVTIRGILYGNLDLTLNKFCEYLKQDKNIKYTEDKESLKIRINETKEKSLIRLITREGYSLQNLLDDSNELSQQEILKTRRILTEVIKSLIIKLYKEEEINSKTITELLEIKGFMESCPRTTVFNEVINYDNSFNLENISLERNKELNILQEKDNNLNTEYYKNTYKKNNVIKNFKLKCLSRNYVYITKYLRLSITFVYNNVLIGHNNSADLSLLNDFESFKSKLDIVNKGMITLGKGFRYENYNVIIRDTMLLAPAGQKSLSSIGKLYNFDKLFLTEYEISHMDELLKTDKDKFLNYAIRDAQITLKHAIWMENFNFQLRGIGIPTTLSNIGNKFVQNYWFDKGYLGYQLDVAPEFLIGEASKMQTPLGLSKFGELGLKIGMYISNYKGGRNESFMYGVDLNTKWYDYDLTSAYTTILSNAGHPDYHNGNLITLEKLKSKSFESLVNSYIIIKCNFRFPKDTKYPSIPVYVDETTTVYPLEGTEVILTGAEYYLAQSQGCFIKILEIFMIPFYENCEERIYPFKDIINEIQSKRRDFPKGTVSNLMYKEIGNSIYGSVVRGMADKRKYDNKTGQTIRLGAHFLTNPLIASWLTGFIRSVIGECLHNIQLLQGTVVSVTTDGFITNIPDLENEILNNLLCSNSNKLLKYYRNLRDELSGIENSLELKQETNGIISWATRGQLGVTSNLRATTGFQNKNYSQDQLIEILGSKLNIYNTEKTIEFLQTSLRSAVEISKQGGHVTMKYEDRKFSLLFDNRREIIDKPLIEKLLYNINELKVLEYYKNNEKLLNDLKYNILVKSKDCYSYSDLFKLSLNLLSENDNIDLNNIFILLDSIPLKDSSTCFNLRNIANKFRVTEYNQRTNTLIERKYKNYTDVAIRSFIKSLLCKPPLYPEIAKDFISYNDLINFIKDFNPKYKISKSSLSHLKHRKLINYQVPRTDETILFISYVKRKYPNFDDSLFFRN